MKKLDEILAGVRSAAIAGHVNPDGDCVGSVMGLYVYLKENYPQIAVTPFLERLDADFDHMPCLSEVKLQAEPDQHYDLVILLDSSSPDRIGVLGDYAALGDKIVVIDHHLTNTGFGDVNHVAAGASSACEVLFELLDEEKISRDCALCLYTGIVTDSGVFQYDSTSERTMQIAGRLMARGIPFTYIIQKVFFTKTYCQQLLLSRVIADSRMYAGDRCLAGVITEELMKETGAGLEDVSGIVSHLKNTKGVLLAVLLHERAPGVFKISLRSDDPVSAAVIASTFGGGGHVKAAGCTISGEPEEIIGRILCELDKQL